MQASLQIELVNHSRTYNLVVDGDVAAIAAAVDRVKVHGFHVVNRQFNWVLEEFPASVIAQVNVLSNDRDAIAKASASLEAQ